jgi:14-3-3 protein epsilon
MATVAEACERYSDMIAILSEVMRRCSDSKRVLTASERSLVGLAFKARLSSARGTLKMLGLVAEHETVAVHLAAVQAYARVMEANVLALAKELINLSQTYQLPLCEDALSTAMEGNNSTPDSERAGLVEAVIFWYKLGADYCRYVSECHTDASTVATHSDMALSFYSKARQYASLYLHPASATSLGVALNFTVFLFEVRRCEDEAHEIAKAALEEATAALHATTPTAAMAGLVGAPGTPEAMRETEAVLRLIRENLRVWSTVLSTNALVV